MGSGRSEVEGVVGIVHSRRLSVFTTPPLAAGAGLAASSPSLTSAPS